MSIKESIKEELLKMINKEKESLDLRLRFGGDVFEISCQEKFLKSLETFANSL